MPKRPLHGWTVLSLRPCGQHAAVRATASRQGATVLALSPFAIALRDDAASRASLESALSSEIIIVTSPNAVRAATALQPLRARADQIWLAVGDATRRALQHAGVHAVSPARMDSEGLLAMPVLRDVTGQRVGLLTAPGGRGMLAPALTARGAHVLRADLYARVPARIPPARWSALEAVLAAPEQVVMLLSSAEALGALLAQLPPALSAAFLQVRISAASERLAGMACNAGFSRIAIAGNPRPAHMLHAAVDAFV